MSDVPIEEAPCGVMEMGRSKSKARNVKKTQNPRKKKTPQNDGRKRHRDLQIKPEDAGSHLSLCLDEIGIGN